MGENQVTKHEVDQLRLEAQAELLRRVVERTKLGHEESALKAAEAFAWIIAPAQNHRSG
jgi:hypothetical protein